ncbi:MAG: L-aspartate oxidase [Melioribacteraceae bacterium]|nr:L-aspartate oxidase [Melioribacteraceae bacterium]
MKYDFVIVGSGLAGLYCSYLASKYGSVALLTKSSIKHSSSYWAQGGIAAVLHKNDSTKSHFQDTIDAGRGLCNEENVEILVTEGRERVLELIELGVKFDVIHGEFVLGLEGGHSGRRVLHAGGAETGKHLVAFLVNHISHDPNINVFENFYAYDLISSEDSCRGIKTFDLVNNETYFFHAQSVIISSGGLSGMFSRSTNPSVSTGDGIYMAYKAGAQIMDTEFIQFHPTTFYSETGDTFLISEAVRGEGAYILNHSGERFLLQFDNKSELAPRDVVSTAIHNEMLREGKNHVYLDTRHLPGEMIKTRFANIYNSALEYGIDITKALLPIAPAAHYTIGGIKTDSYSMTNIKNLYACGEVAANGIHGANRLASNSLLECLVFGYRAVESSVKNASGFVGSDYDINEIFKIDESFRKNFIEIKKIIAEITFTSTGIIRDKKHLNAAMEKLDKLYAEYSFGRDEYFSNQSESLINLTGLIIKSALAREESRGCHLRAEFPEQRNYFLGNFVHQVNSKLKFIEKKNQSCL